MNKLQIIGLILAIVSCTAVVSAQSSITFGGTQSYNTLKFKDSKGTSMNSEYNGIITGGYTLGYRYSLPGGIMFNAGIGMRKAGATLNLDTMSYSWDLKYADFRLGAGYMLQGTVVRPYINISGYYGMMLEGTQVLNNEHFNILKNKAVNTSDYGVIFSPGVQYSVNNNISAFFEFDYLLGLQNIEKDASQKTKNVAYQATIGLVISIGK